MAVWGNGVSQADLAALPPAVHHDLWQPCCRVGQWQVPSTDHIDTENSLHDSGVHVWAYQLERTQHMVHHCAVTGTGAATEFSGAATEFIDAHDKLSQLLEALGLCRCPRLRECCRALHKEYQWSHHLQHMVKAMHKRDEFCAGQLEAIMGTP